MIIVSRLQDDLGIEDPPEMLYASIMEDVDHDVDLIRRSCALSLAKVLEKNDTVVPAVIAQLLDLYEEKLYVSATFIEMNIFFKNSRYTCVNLA